MLVQFANEIIQLAETHQFPTYSALLMQMPWVGGLFHFFNATKPTSDNGLMTVALVSSEFDAMPESEEMQMSLSWW